MRSYGAGGLLVRLSGGGYGIDDSDYEVWISRFDSPTEERRKQLTDRLATFSRQPLISVLVPTYNPQIEHLRNAIVSVQKQIYAKWELCIADDCSPNSEVRSLLRAYTEADDRIKLVFRDTNGHICAATNSALDVASGEFIALLDQDDELSDHALFHIVAAINAHPDAKLIYSDEDKLNERGERCQPYFKSDWNYDLFLCHNMISHLGVYDRELVNTLGGFRDGLQGSQDWDLALRVIEVLRSDQIVHVAKILYHWRIHEQSTSALGSEAKPYAYKAAEIALNEHFSRQNVKARAEFLPELGAFRTRYALPDKKPLVSIIIPTRNGFVHLKACVESILDKTTYPAYELIIVNNGSDDPETCDYIEELGQHERLRVISDPAPFNYARINNDAASAARGDLFAFVNDDIEVISPDWLEEMVSVALQQGVGAVGAKLLYPDNTIQHAGIVLGVNGVADHCHMGLPESHLGYFSKAVLMQSFNAVTAACLVVQRQYFEAVGGFDAQNLSIAFNDVDLCLKLVEQCNLRNVFTPYARLYHHESLSRGYETTPEKQERFLREMKYMETRWPKFLAQDHMYNLNFSKQNARFQLDLSGR